MKRRYSPIRSSDILPLAWLVCAVAGIPLAHAQGVPSRTPLAFDVATVKPSDTSKVVHTELRVYPGGRLIIHGHNLHALISEAFDLPAWQITGGPKWMDNLLFDIEGKPAEEFRNEIPGGEYSIYGIQDVRIRSMLQALLVERFHLKSHMESHPGTVYLLKRGDGPLRLKSTTPDLYKRSEDGSVAINHAYPTGDMGMVSGVPVSIFQTSMAQLARQLGNIQRVPVSDETALPGFYNFRSRTVPTDEDFKGKDQGPMYLLLDAVPEMGLKLVKADGMVSKFVVDDAELPTPN